MDLKTLTHVSHRTLLALSCAVLLHGCGQKGPLYLSEPLNKAVNDEASLAEKAPAEDKQETERPAKNSNPQPTQ